MWSLFFNDSTQIGDDLSNETQNLQYATLLIYSGAIRSHRRLVKFVMSAFTFTRISGYTKSVSFLTVAL